MTERLDRIEAILLATAERQNEMNASLQKTQAVLDRTAQQQARQADEIDTLLGAVSTNEVGIRALVTKIDESNERFEILRQEAIASQKNSDSDRTEYARRFDAQLADAKEQKVESDRRFDEQRVESNRRFSEQMTEIRAQGEQIRALLSALAGTNGRIDGLEQAS